MTMDMFKGTQSLCFCLGKYSHSVSFVDEADGIAMHSAFHVDGAMEPNSAILCNLVTCFSPHCVENMQRLVEMSPALQLLEQVHKHEQLPAATEAEMRLHLTQNLLAGKKKPHKVMFLMDVSDVQEHALGGGGGGGGGGLGINAANGGVGGAGGSGYIEIWEYS